MIPQRTNSDIDVSRESLLSFLLAYTQRIDSRKIDEGMIPPFILNDLGREGLFGMGIPREYGGLDLPVSDILEILGILAATDMSVAILILDSLLSAYTIRNYASDEIKSAYLPEMAKGRILSAVAITEDAAGSNPRAMEAYAVQNEDGDWVINGGKRWVGYASWAGFINVYTQTIVNGQKIGISGFFVPAGTEGVEIGEEAKTMGIKGFPKHSVTFRNVVVPKTHTLGTIGKGMESAQSTFMFVRLCMGGICLGAVKRLIQIGVNYAYNRQIATGQLIENPVSRITLTQLINSASALEILNSTISAQLDRGIEVPEAAFVVCKTFGGELLSLTADKSMQMLGARGYEEANMVAQMYRDGRPFRIFEGPTEVLINYLGTQAYLDSGEVYQLLEKNFDNQAISQKLKDFVKNIKEKYLANNFFEGQHRDIWAYSVIGEVTQWMILQAVIEHQEKVNPSLSKWIYTKVNELILRYEREMAEETGLLSVLHILKTSQKYAVSIGDFSPKRYGDNQSVDRRLLSTFQLPKINSEDEQKVLYEWNQEMFIAPEHNLLGLLKASVLSYPDNTAIEYADESITYLELDRLASRLAMDLQKKGIKSGNLVGICYEKSIDMIVGIIGVLKAGAGYVPIDRSYPKHRMEGMIAETSLKLILAQSHIRTLPDIGVERLDLDEALEVYKQNPEPQENFELQYVNYQDSNPAYVIFTSGSTGTPKGVVISHRAVANFAQSSIKKYELTAQDRVLQFASISFDAAVEEIFCALGVGATLVLRTEDMLDSYEGFLAKCEDAKVSVLDLPTAFWTNLVKDPIVQKYRKLPSTLKTLILGGDKVTEEGLASWDKLTSENINLWDTYGPTEATVVAVSKLLRSPDEDNNSQEALVIGRPDENVCVYILDEDLQPVSIGEKGELCIGGANLGTYLNREELNKEKFIENPFLTKDQRNQQFNTKLYRSGDLVKYTSKGEIQFLGRIDNQVKIRGYRVELEEVEKVLAECEMVQNCVILAHKQDGFNELFAAVILKNNDPEVLNMMQEYMESKLPAYMIPARIQIFDRFPMTISKKIDRKALLKDMARSMEIEEEDLLNGDTSAVLSNIWRQILGVKVDAHSNFFSVGGHSLSVMQLLGKIQERFEVSVSVREFYRHQTIDELSKLIDEKNGDNQPPQAVSCMQLMNEPVMPQENIIEYPLSKIQKQFFVHSQMHANVPLYNEPCLLQTSRSINLETLENALNQLIARHDLLRTSFHTTETGIIQRCHPSVSFTVEYSDFSQEEAEGREEKMKVEAQRQLEVLFELDQPCLMRCQLFNMGEDDTRIFFTFHHLIIDGLSLFSIFVPELEALLLQKYEKLAPLNCHNRYGIFAEEKQQVNPETANYWKNHLSNIDPLVLPYDIKSGKGKGTGKQMIKEFSGEEMNHLSQKLRCSRFNVMATSLGILLNSYSSKDSVLFGTAMSTRSPEMKHTLGLFLNTVMIKTNTPYNQTIQEYAFHVQDTVLEAQEYPIPYEDLLATLPQSGEDDLLKVAIVYEPVVEHGNMFEINRRVVHNGASKFELLFEFEEQKNSNILLKVEYDHSLFTAETIARLLDHFQTILHQINTNPNLLLGEIDIRTELEKSALIVPKKPYLSLSCHELFEQQVLATPYQTAISFEQEHLSYGELNHLSNQIGHFLAQEGIKKGDFVGLYLPRSIEQIATVIAILKIGAVYVPLDPAYPASRLQYIAQKTEITTLVTDISLPPLAIKLPKTMLLGQKWAQIKRQDNRNHQIENLIEQPAYVVFTSGSTGVPKGAQVSHRTLSNLMQWQVERSARNNKTIQYTPLSFDVSFQEIFSTLASGGELVIVDEEIRKNPIELVKYIKEKQVARLFLPYVALKQISEVVSADLAPVPDSLQEVITAGEQLKVTEDVKAFFDRMPLCTLDNQYGPCETHVVTAGLLKPESRSQWPALPTIGAAVSNVDLKVLNDKGRDIPANIPGELYLSVADGTHGYINNETETEKRFIQIEDRDFYKTGDIVSYGIDGNVQWLDRVDNQLKIRGFRVETGEVECALTNDPDIQQAVVTAIEQAGEKVLVAYVQLKHENEGPDIAALVIKLKQNLNKLLPAYMIPSHFMRVEKFELTPSGKIARKLLPAFELATTIALQNRHDEGKVISDFAAIKSPEQMLIDETESKIVRLFAQVLELDSALISRNVNFFDLGGSSLTGFLLVTRVSKTFNVQLNPSILFKNPTPHLLAELLVDKSEITASSLVELRKGDGHPPIFLLPGSGGTLVSFENLLNELPEDRSIFGFVHPKLRGNDVDCPTVYDLASFYVKCMEEEGLMKDCYIAGHSFGGAIAYEMTQILKRKGWYAVPIILDTPVPQDETKTLTDDMEYSNWAAVVGEVLAHNAGHILHLVDDMKDMNEASGLAYLKQRLVNAKLYGEHDSVEHLKALIDMIQEFDIAFINYEPAYSEESIYLIRAKDFIERDELGILASGSDHPYWGWEKVSNSVNMTEVNGDHLSMLNKDYASEVAETIIKCLQENDFSLNRRDLKLVI